MSYSDRARARETRSQHPNSLRGAGARSKDGRGPRTPCPRLLAVSRSARSRREAASTASHARGAPHRTYARSTPTTHTLGEYNRSYEWSAGNHALPQPNITEELPMNAASPRPWDAVSKV